MRMENKEHVKKDQLEDLWILWKTFQKIKTFQNNSESDRTLFSHWSSPLDDY